MASCWIRSLRKAFMFSLIADHVHRAMQYLLQFLLDSDEREQIRIRQFDHDINVTLTAELIARGRVKDSQADDAELITTVLLKLRECLQDVFRVMRSSYARRYRSMPPADQSIAFGRVKGKVHSPHPGIPNVPKHPERSSGFLAAQSKDAALLARSGALRLRSGRFSGRNSAQGAYAQVWVCNCFATSRLHSRSGSR